MRRKGTGEVPFGIVETQVTLTCYSDEDRLFYAYSRSEEDKHIKLEIFRGYDSWLYWAGSLGNLANFTSHIATRKGISRSLCLATSLVWEV